MIPPEMFGTMNRQGYTMLADGRVRHVGEPVAVVAAAQKVWTAMHTASR